MSERMVTPEMIAMGPEAWYAMMEEALALCDPANYADPAPDPKILAALIERGRVEP